MLDCDFLGKKQLVPPIPAKMLFKAGTEEIMKFPIGVITNSVGEVLVGDTGNQQCTAARGSISETLAKRYDSSVVTALDKKNNIGSFT